MGKKRMEDEECGKIEEDGRKIEEDEGNMRRHRGMEEK